MFGFKKVKMTSHGRNSKILQLLNARIKVTIQDGRVLIGQMIAFDKYMNLVLNDCQQVKSIGVKKESQTLGLVILRGENIISLSVEQHSRQAKQVTLPAGIGRGIAVGRGISHKTTGLTAPVSVAK